MRFGISDDSMESGVFALLLLLAPFVERVRLEDSIKIQSLRADSM